MLGRKHGSCSLSACSHSHPRWASHQVGPESIANNLNQLGPRRGWFWHKCVRAGASVGSGGLTEAVLCSWNVPFVPLTVEPDGSRGQEWSRKHCPQGTPVCGALASGPQAWPMSSVIRTPNTLAVTSYLRVLSLGRAATGQPWARPASVIPRGKQLED